jgi:hypothetical protein
MYYSDVKREVFEVFYLNPVFFRSLVRSRVPLGLFVTVLVTLLGNNYEDADGYAG